MCALMSAFGGQSRPDMLTSSSSAYDPDSDIGPGRNPAAQQFLAISRFSSLRGCYAALHRNRWRAFPMLKLALSAIAASLLALNFISNPAQAQTRVFVSATGSDSNPCTF